MGGSQSPNLTLLPLAQSRSTGLQLESIRDIQLTRTSNGSITMSCTAILTEPGLSTAPLEIKLVGQWNADTKAASYVMNPDWQMGFGILHIDGNMVAPEFVKVGKDGSFLWGGRKWMP